jgi:exopolysaccharide biosynthesis polyprenyl glycosylphosphotransferase
MDLTSDDVASAEVKMGSRDGALVDPGSTYAESARASTAVRRIARRPRIASWWPRDALRRRLLGIADALSALLAMAVPASVLPDIVWAPALVPVWLVVAKALGLYDRDHRSIRHLTIDEVPALAAWALVGAGTLAGVRHLAGDHASTEDSAAVALIAFVSVCPLRAAARAAWRRLVPPERTLIVGEGEPAEMTRRKLKVFPEMHLELVKEMSSSAFRALRQSNGALVALVRKVDRVVVATDEIDPVGIAALAGACRDHSAKLSAVSPLRGRSQSALHMTQVGDLAVFEFDTWDVPRSTALMKRTFDLVFSAGALLLLAPVLPLIAIAIRAETPGPVIYTQRRVGRRGRPFRMFKFRSMVHDAEERLSEVVDLDALEEPAFKMKRDPRVTRVGRVLRRWSLDELPQMLNVLRGNMSLVGPRPEQVEVVQLYHPEHRFRLDVKPGITGPMQVCGRGELTFGERLAVELDYVENISLFRDLRILVLTIPRVFRGTGAY